MAVIKISIHAPREGSDAGGYARQPDMIVFLSTLPARGATRWKPSLARWSPAFLSTLPARGATKICETCEGLIGISIHAPREGSDLRSQSSKHSLAINFYPRSPRGERHVMKKYCGPDKIFLSTLPARGATQDKMQPQP